MCTLVPKTATIAALFFSPGSLSELYFVIWRRSPPSPALQIRSTWLLLKAKLSDKNKGKQIQMCTQRFWVPRSILYRWTHIMLWANTYDQIDLYCKRSVPRRIVNQMSRTNLYRTHAPPHNPGPLLPFYLHLYKKRDSGYSQHKHRMYDNFGCLIRIGIYIIS